MTQPQLRRRPHVQRERLPGKQSWPHRSRRFVPVASLYARVQHHPQAALLASRR
jgi:hypothetical protein